MIPPSVPSEAGAAGNARGSVLRMITDLSTPRQRHGRRKPCMEHVGEQQE